MSESVFGLRVGAGSACWYVYSNAGDGRRIAIGRVIVRPEEEARGRLRHLSRGGGRITISRRPFAGARL
ncbi:MAG TPA: hypothetical protein PLQ19_06580 [Aeromicrobium sp.]|nr:hypothetical protein [Aeromicrobium sp.]